MFYDWSSFSRGFITSLLTFVTIRYVLSRIISYKDKQQHWKYVNISTSLIHSIFSSIICIYWLVNNSNFN